MGLYHSIKDAAESFYNKSKVLLAGSGKISVALLLVFFKTAAGAGQAIFGARKHLEYVGLASEENEPQAWYEISYTATIVGFTVVTSILTRGGNTCRTILGHYYLYDYVFNPLGMGDPKLDERRARRRIAAANRRQNEANIPALGKKYIPSTKRLAVFKAIDYGITGISVTSSTFASISTYNFGRHFMEYITHQKIATASKAMTRFMMGGALSITAANFFSNLNYNSRKARAAGTAFARWITNIEVDEFDRLFLLKERTWKNIWRDMQKWVKPAGIMAPNCLANEPANAFFTTEDAMLITPVVVTFFGLIFNDPETGIFAFALVSSAAIIVQTAFTSIPSLRKYLDNNADPWIDEALADLKELHPRGYRLYQAGLICGGEDSIATIFSFIYAICYTVNRFFPSIDTHALFLISLATIIACTKGGANFLFSVRSALWDLLEDIYPVIFEEARERHQAKVFEEQKIEQPLDENQEIAEYIVEMGGMDEEASNAPTANVKKEKKKKGKKGKRKNKKTDDELLYNTSSDKSKNGYSQILPTADDLIEHDLHPNRKMKLSSTFKYVGKKLSTDGGLQDSLLENDFKAHSDLKIKKPLHAANHHVVAEHHTEMKAGDSSHVVEIHDEENISDLEAEYCAYIPPVLRNDPSHSNNVNHVTGSPLRKPVDTSSTAIPPLSIKGPSLFAQKEKIHFVQSEPIRAKAVYGKYDQKNKHVVTSIGTFTKLREEKKEQEAPQNLNTRTPKPKRKSQANEEFSWSNNGLYNQY